MCSHDFLIWTVKRNCSTVWPFVGKVCRLLFEKKIKRLVTIKLLSATVMDGAIAIVEVKLLCLNCKANNKFIQ